MRAVTVSVQDAGTYKIEAMVNGDVVTGKTAKVPAGGTIQFDGVTMNEVGAAFIKVEKTS